MQNPQSLCDLHIHSYYSDGALSPGELVRKSEEAGLSAISITDHDTVDGLSDALESAESSCIEMITGVEFNIREAGKDVHLLGYLFDHRDKKLVDLLNSLKEARKARAESIVSKLACAGISIDMEEVRSLSGRGTVGRLHIARVLLEKGYVDDIQEGFSKYIGEGRPAFVPRIILKAADTVSLIRSAGGVAVWAHPGALIRNRGLVKTMVDSGISGIETVHPNHNSEIVEKIRSVAQEKGLVTTGGSDYHFDEAMKAAIGEMGTTYQAVIDLRKMI
ncbi:MAG: PHP domain-containing protein [Candidatus Krumholzibacteriota bacterium]|nr:PHP domain-containing protein [Candidatus Krumholzibacteriota bacterium]